MLKVTSKLTTRQIVGAFHQSEGVIITTENEEQYSFVPDTPIIGTVKKSHCSGTIYPYTNGKFSEREYNADLYFFDSDSPDRRVEIDILDII